MVQRRPRLRRHLHRVRGVLPGPQQPGARHPGHPQGSSRVLQGAARHGDDGPGDRLRRLEVPDGVGVRPQQSEVLPAAGPAALVRHHRRLRTVNGVYTSLGLLIVPADRSTDGSREWAGRPAARRWCTGSARRSGASSCRPGTWRTTWAAPSSRTSPCSASRWFGDWGAEVLLQRRHCRDLRGRRVLPAAGHAAIARPAAHRAVQERLPARLQRRPRAHVHVQGDLLRARPDEQVPVG